MSDWISVEETPHNFHEETKVLILLKETENCWFPEVMPIALRRLGGCRKGKFLSLKM